MATINKDALAAKVLEFDMFASKKQSKEFVEDFFQIIADAIIAGDTVSIAGFGKFENFERQNGTHKAKFSAFKDLKDAVKAAN